MVSYFNPLIGRFVWPTKPMNGPIHRILNQFVSPCLLSIVVVNEQHARLPLIFWEREQGFVIAGPVCLDFGCIPAGVDLAQGQLNMMEVDGGVPGRRVSCSASSLMLFCVESGSQGYCQVDRHWDINRTLSRPVMFALIVTVTFDGTCLTWCGTGMEGLL